MVLRLKERDAPAIDDWTRDALTERRVDVKLGFLTACMPERPLSEGVHFASAHGYQTLEVACWPRTSERDYNASHIDVTTLDHAGSDEIRRMCELSGLSISALAYYENNLAADPNERAVVNGHLRKAIDAAALLGVGLVGTFVGHDLSKTPAKNGEEAARVFGELTDYAGQKGVRLMIENCPMVGWQRPFAAVPALGLNLDPSHLYWLGVNPYAVARAYGAHVFHAHAKDNRDPARQTPAHADPRRRLVALPHARPRRARLAALHQRPARGRLRRCAQHRARGPRLGGDAR